MPHASFTFLIFLAFLNWAKPVWAGPCDAAARAAAERFGVPEKLLFTLTRVETGRAQDRGLEPWPWTVNSEGQGYFFETLQEAVDFAQSELEQDRISIDIGCFQVNVRWHSRAFGSLEQMFDPMENASYAAQFLTSLLDETGSWEAAIKAYHSRDSALADRYYDRVLEVANALTEPADMPMAVQDQRTRGQGMVRFPLFVQGEAGSSGSLVPQSDAYSPLIGG